MRHGLTSIVALSLFALAGAGRPAVAQKDDTGKAYKIELRLDAVDRKPPVAPVALPPASDEALLRDAKIPTDGAGLIEFLRKRTVDSADKARLEALIVQLGDDSFAVREQASAQLVATGARAKPLLQKATTDPDIEVKRRAQDCMHRIDQGATSMVVSAAIRLLAQRKPAGAAEVLLTYLPSAEDDSVAEEVRGGLAVLALRDAKPEPAVLAALTDREPMKRAAAGVALCRAKIAEQMPAVRKLLKDDDALVRMRIGLALVAAKEKEAVPVLIDLLTQLPSRDTGMVEELLYQVAADKAPSGDGGSDEASRRRYRDAWKKWWDEDGAKLDLAKLEEASKTLGYTLVLLLDAGKAMELDNANRPRWIVEGLEFPLDVQLLPGDRLLSAEHNGNKVTERDAKDKGKIVWEYPVPQPLAAQRLPNGNTLIATRTGLVEVNKAKEVKWQYSRPGGEILMKAQKLRNGDVALVTQVGATRFVLIDKDGKEKKSFGVNVHTSGGRIDVLPNGNVVVPENANNKVVEHAPDGKVVWEAAIEGPVAAVRLANGHTLVTTMNPARGAVEIDRTGKEVWNYKTDTRVNRAFRR